MGDSKNLGDPKSDHIEQPDEMGRVADKARNTGSGPDPSDELDDLLYFNDDQADDHHSSSLPKEPDSSEIPDSAHSHQEVLKPPRPTDSDKAIDNDFAVPDDSEPVEDHSAPLREPNKSTQNDGLFDLFGEDEEGASSDETISGNSGPNDAVHAQPDSQDQFEDLGDPATSRLSDSDNTNGSVDPGFEVEPGPESGFYKGAENQSDTDPVFEQEFELDSELEVELDGNTDPGHELDANLDPDLESVIDGGESVRSRDSEDNSTYEKEFSKILNEETARTRNGVTDNRPLDDAAAQNIPDDIGDTELSYESPPEADVSQSKLEAEAETYTTVKSILSDADRGTAQDHSDDSENDGVPPQVDNQPAQDQTGNQSRRKLASNVQSSARKTLEFDLEEGEEMKWFTIGVPIAMVVVVMVMGGYLFSLQSQIDELHLLLPLDQENVFGSDTPTSVDLADDAVIENINARIDNLADTLELIANANQRDDQNLANEAILQPDSGSSDTGNGGAANRVAAVLAGEAEIGVLNSRLDGLSKSLETISGTINQHGSQIKELKILAKSRALTPKGIKKEFQPPPPLAKNKISEGSGVVVTRNEETIGDPSARPFEKPIKPLVPVKSPINKEQWSVNLMSLKDEAIAKKQIEAFRKQGVSAEINRKRISGKTWYRVQVSGFKTKQQANKYAASVKKKLGLSSTWVTR